MISSPLENEPHASTTNPPHDLKALQYNLHHSHDVHHALLNDRDLQEYDILFLSEPYVANPGRKGYHIPSAPWELIQPEAPETLDHPPRSAILISRRLLPFCLPIATPSPDITAIKVTPPGLPHPLYFINVYNQPQNRPCLDSLQQLLSSPPFSHPDTAITILGDFNAHSPIWEPGRNPDQEAEMLLTTLASVGAQLQSQIGVPTFHNTRGHTSVIDLVFTTPPAAALYTRCETSTTKIDNGSDHLPILHSLAVNVPETNRQPRRKWEEAEWGAINGQIRTKLMGWQTPGPHAQEIDRAVESITEIIQDALNEHVPTADPPPFCKRWWSKELDELRRRANRTRRAYQTNHSHETKIAFRKARSEFQNAVRKYKQQHWNEYLATIDDTNVFKAAKYATKVRQPNLIPPLKRHDGTLANTPAEQADTFLSTFFTPPPEPDLSDIPDPPDYPPSVTIKRDLTIEEFDQELANMAPNKAPGPDEIPVSVLRRIWDSIREPLFNALQQAWKIGHYPTKWKEAISLILRKLGKPDYSQPNAYRPIALLCTLGKLFEGVICRRLSYITEHHKLLPNGHIGCRPRRSTDDALVSLTQLIKNSWRRGKVVACLQLDVKSAFTTVDKRRLIHNMRKRRVPEIITKIIDSFLSDRRSSVKTGTFCTEQAPCMVGIPQGSPLSGLLYLFYNSPLVDLANAPTVTVTLDSQGYADDINISATGKTTREARNKLQNAIPHTLIWSRQSSSTLDVQKTKYIVFTRNRAKIDDTPLMFGQHAIPPSETVIYLGVEFDTELRWNAHGARAAAKGHRALMAISALTRTTWGMPLHHFRRLYTSVVIPRIDYAAIVWHQYGRHTSKTIQLIKKTHHLALRLMLGALRTTPISALEHDTALPTPPHRLDRTVTLAAARLLTLPKENPAGPLARKALASNVKKHRTPLHFIFHSENSFLFPRDLEIIVPTTRPPWWQTDFKRHIAVDKEKAMEYHNTLLESQHREQAHIYSDGSKTNEGIGAAAVNMADQRVLSQNLGGPHHTVFEAELVGVSLALELADSLPRHITSCVIHLDNQAAIIALTRNPRAKSGQSIISHIHDQRAALRSRRRHLNVTLNWVPGHEGIPGNEEADEHAKNATDAETPPSHNHLIPPTSLSAVRTAIKAHLRFNLHENTPSENGRHHRMLIGELDGKSTLAMLSDLPRGSCSIITQLRSGHAPLAAYLHRFKAADSPLCDRCSERETVTHYLLHCHKYTRQRHRLRVALAKQDLPASSLTHLLSDTTAIKITVVFIKATRRFPRNTPAIPIAPKVRPSAMLLMPPSELPR